MRSMEFCELPCDILHHISHVLVEYHQHDSTKFRRVNKQFNMYVDCFLQSKYESQVISMLSACRISVLSQKARLKYTLQYMRSIECVEIEESEIEEKAKEPPAKLGIVMIYFFIILVFFIILN